MFSYTFLNIPQFGPNISTPNHQNIVKGVLPDILTPLGHLGINSGDISFLYLFLIFLYDSATWRIFFIILKLKPDVTFIDLACLKVTI